MNLRKIPVIRKMHSKYRKNVVSLRNAIRNLRRWYRDVRDFSISHFWRIKMASKRGPRGRCVWCQDDITRDQHACEVCKNCPEFLQRDKNHPQYGKPKFIHIGLCTRLAPCRTCKYGTLNQVQ